MAERLLTPEEVAQRLAVSVRTILNMLRDGRLSGVKVGKFWRIKEEDLQAFIDKSGAEDT